MILLLISVAALVVCLYMSTQGGPYSDRRIAGQFGVTVIGALVGIQLISIPCSRMIMQGQIQQFKSVDATLQAAREAGNAFENAALQQKVVDTNRWLADAQYWRGTTFWIYIPEEIEDLEPIK